MVRLLKLAFCFSLVSGYLARIHFRMDDRDTPSFSLRKLTACESTVVEQDTSMRQEQIVSYENIRHVAVLSSAKITLQFTRNIPRIAAVREVGHS